MLWLKQMNQPFEVRKCKISGQFIVYGDFYYEDDEDGVCIKASVYRQIKEENRRNRFDYSKLQQASSEKEYKELLNQAEKEALKSTILNRKIAEKGEIRDSGIE